MRLTDRMAFEKFPTFSEPQFPHIEGKDSMMFLRAIFLDLWEIPAKDQSKCLVIGIDGYSLNVLYGNSGYFFVTSFWTEEILPNILW